MKRARLFVLLFTLLMIALMSVRCAGPTRTVSRVQVDKAIDISGRWNDTDSRMTAQAMVKEILSSPWLDNFVQENDRKPTVIVGRIQNRTSEHLDTGLFIKDIEKTLINSGSVTFVASGKARKEIRSERLDQQSHANVETAKELANEQGADFMLQGAIYSATDSFEGKAVVLYKVNLELINLETNTKAWIGDKQIKKFIQQDKYKW